MRYHEKIEMSDGNTLLTFLKEVKGGKYGPVEESSLPYARIKEETVFINIEEDYYYSISWSTKIEIFINSIFMPEF